MIVVVIIGILASLGLPAFQQVRMGSQNARLYQDFRVFAAAADTYMLEFGADPFTDGDFGDPGAATLSAQMQEYIKLTDFTTTPPIGGQYLFSTNSGAFFGVGVTNYTVDDNQITLMDEKQDDGSLSTGNLRKVGSTDYYLVIQE